MSASTVGVNSVAEAARGFVRPRAGHAHPAAPDMLEHAYLFARRLPPVVAASMAWTALHRHGMVSFSQWAGGTLTIRHAIAIVVLVAVWSQFFRMRNTHTRAIPRFEFVLSQLGAVCAGTLACALLLWIGRVVSPHSGVNDISIVVFSLRCAAGGATCVVAAAILYEIAYRTSRPHLYIIVGTRRKAIDAYKRLHSHGERRGIVLGFIDPDDSHAKYLPGDYLGTLDQLERMLMANPVDRVHLTLPLKSQYAAVQEAIWTCERLGVECSFSDDDMFDTQIGQLDHTGLRHVRASVYRMAQCDYRLLLKRAIDIVLASMLLIVCAPLMLLIALGVKLSSRGPVFFVQERYGQNRRRFKMYKFRSMVADAEERIGEIEHQNEASGPIFKIRKDPRTTSIGRMLRKLSLDELPQLFNILKGEMSLVGPRPMSLRDVHLFSEAWLMRRFSVRPGLTGLWQVSGRSNTNFETWIRLDLYYIDRWSLGLDLKILLRTVPTVLFGAGAA